MQTNVEAAVRELAWRALGDRPADGLPPGPGIPAAAQLALWLSRPWDFLSRCDARYGNPFTVSLPNFPRIVSFCDAEANKEVFTGPPDELYAGLANEPLRPIVGRGSLLLLDGPRHVRERRLLLPPFHGARMQAYGAVIRDLTLRAMERWPLGVPFPIHHEMQSITLDVILRTIFGVDEGEDLAELRAALVHLVEEFSPATMVPTLQIDLGPRSPWGRFVRARSRVDALLFRLIETRRRERARGRDDILTLLLEARYEDGAPMSDSELRDELMTLLAAGHETSATALAWTFHQLTRHPHVEGAVGDELDALLGSADDDAVTRIELPYLDGVLKETMRLQPVIAVVGRVLQRPRTIAGWDLPAGTLVTPSVYLTHRNPDLWPEPLRFDPSRFVGTKISPYAYMPFGGGVRRCIGMAFALYEMRIILATALSRLRVRAAPGAIVRPERRSVTMAPSGGSPVVLSRRRVLRSVS